MAKLFSSKMFQGYYLSFWPQQSVTTVGIHMSTIIVSIFDGILVNDQCSQHHWRMKGSRWNPATQPAWPSDEILLYLVCMTDWIFTPLKFWSLIHQSKGIMCHHVMFRGHRKPSFGHAKGDVSTNRVAGQECKHQASHIRCLLTSNPEPWAILHRKGLVDNVGTFSLSGCKLVDGMVCKEQNKLTPNQN